MRTPKVNSCTAAIWIGVAALVAAPSAANAGGKNSAPPPKPAAAPSKAAPKPASGGGAKTAPGSRGAKAAGKGPTTSGSRAGRGVTTATPAGRGVTPSPAAGRATATPGRGAVASVPRAAPNATRMAPAAGAQVHMRPGGKPSDVRVASRGMAIHHGLDGNRRVAVERPDHSRIVSERGGRGYVQRPYAFRGHEFAHRTYWAHGRAYDRFYRSYLYRGVYLDVYAPEFYYETAFYGWVYNPWASPVAYTWGWGAAPWRGYYSSYFAPYPAYPNASLWLTDYLISTSLAASYEARAEAAGPNQAQAFAANPPANGAPALTPQVKEQIAAEIRRQIALENAEARGSAQSADPDPASSGIQRLLSDNRPHVLVPGRGMDVVEVSGVECAVSEGDALQVAGPPAPNASAATLTVLASKGGAECRVGAQVTVPLADLQEMQNHMRETIDQGMGELRSKQGQGGLPAIPKSASAAPVKAPYTAAAPAPEPNVAAEISQQAQAADQAEQEALVQAKPEAPPVSTPGPETVRPPTTVAALAATLTLALGQSIESVTAAVGQPTQIVNLGPKKIYVYKDMKITFTDGKATDIQ